MCAFILFTALLLINPIVMFRKVDPKQSFPQLEAQMLAKWEKEKTFEKSVEQRPVEKSYVFYDGPPFATGLPHYGHILAGTMKDVVPRYWTMRGHRVERRFGWDCHGLPVENEVEKELGLSGKNEIEEKVGVYDFNEKCRSIVLRYTSEWEQTVLRMGRWVDFKNDYKTMNPEFMESVWWVFGQLWDKKLIYQGRKAMHVCPHCVTPLSNFEVTLGYKDIKDPAVVWKFQLVNAPDTFLLAWTTTPWSTLGTVGLSVGPNFTYVKVKIGAEKFIFVKDRMEFVLEGIEDYEVLEEIPGSDLVGLEYEPVLPEYKNLPEVQSNANCYHVFAGDYVEVTEGTGVVTINGAYGEIDMEAANKNGLPILLDVEMDGRYNSMAAEYAGMNVKEAEPKLIADLEAKGLIFKHDKYKHSYPHCWRCDTALLNYAASSWFVKVTDIKEKMLAANNEIHWVPDHVQQGRFGKWLENAKDWCISRNRFWGTPLPIWVCEETGDMICVSSIKQLEELSGKQVLDLHKHFVDEIVIEKDGKTYKRIPEVLDCWFESGSMPYAQGHYPMENKESFESNFPAEFIAEGLDQTRGWFYTLVVLGTALFGKSPFKNVIVNGMILAEDGKKMSKRLKNYTAPEDIFDKYGADALRFYLMNSPVVKAEALRFSDKGVADVVRNIILPLWNSYSFFVTYANIDGWTPEKMVEQKSNRLDKWLISEFEQLLKELTSQLDQYDLQRATEPIVGFINSLTNWYIRRSRRRFWKTENDSDKNEAYSTLFHVMRKLSMILAPFMPFISEEIYTNLTSKESVHLANWPEFEDGNIDLQLNREIELVQKIVSLGLSVRAKHNVKVRQPLAKVEVVGASGLSEQDIQMIEEELNVKEVVFVSDAEKLAKKLAKPIGSLIGPKFGPVVQDIIAQAKAGNFEEKEDGKLLVNGQWELMADEYEMVYEGVEGHFVAGDRGVVVSVDLNITPELHNEGIARDLVRFVQEARKEAGYNVDDHIQLAIKTGENYQPVLETFGQYIQNETLADKLLIGEMDDADYHIDVEVENEAVSLYLKKN